MEQHECIMQDRVRALETGQAETRVYVKEIREDIQEIKTDVKKAAQQPPKQQEESKTWQPIVLKLIELLSTVIIILGAIAGAAKLLGKG